MTSAEINRSKPASYESRSDPRVGCELPVEFWGDGMSGSLRATSRDLSVGGVCILTRSPLDYRSIGNLRIHLPSGPLSVRAAGRWQHWDRTAGVILTGVAFQGLDERSQDLLWDHVLEAGKQLARFLLRHSHLRDIGIDGASALAHASRLALYGPGEMIYREGAVQDSPRSIFVVQEGEVVLRLRVRGAIDTDFASLKPGEVFGGLPMFADVGHHETALARTRVRLIEIDERAYPHLLRSRPGVAQQLANTVTLAHAARMRASFQRSV